MALKGSGTFAKADPNLTQIAALDISGQGGKVLAVNSGGTAYEHATVSAADEKCKVSANDTTAGYLNGKLVAGTNITLTEGTDGGNETLTIASTASASVVEYITRSLEGVVYETTLMYWVCPATAIISSAQMYLSSNPSATGSYCKVQVMKNGLLETNSIFAADAAMQVTEATTATNGVYPGTVAEFDTGNNMDDLAAGDVLWFRVNQADTGSADLAIRVKVTYS